jgi:hypothetical protein
MSWDKGFNFRASSGFVTDGANTTYVLGDAYPTTRNAVTFGWSTSTANLITRDRNVIADPRIAGSNIITSGACTFQVDLSSAGSYTLSLAMGDSDNSAGSGWVGQIDVKDNASALYTVGPIAGQPILFYDPNGSGWSTPNWPGSNTTKTSAFASSTLNLVVSDGGITFGAIAHLFVSQVGGTTTPAQIIFRNVNYV